MASHGNHDHECCSSHIATPSTCQTLDELDFERGIWYPALSGDIDGVKKCIDKGTDLNATDQSGYTALHYAGRNGHYDICSMLLSKGACVNYKTKHGQATPLHRAAYMGHEDIVKLFLAYNADPTCCDSDNYSPVHKALKQGHREVVNLLLEKAPQLSHLLESDKT